MKFYNTNDSYGMAGPFEADSREMLADEMEPTFREWARQDENTADEDEAVAVMRMEFMKGLEEVAND